VRLFQAIPKRQSDGSDSLDPPDLEAITGGIRKRKDWWTLHQQDYAVAPGDSMTLPPRSSGLRAVDFSLGNLNGKTTHLSEFRGKIVVLNFWAIWCTPCLLEISDLIELQKRHADRLVVLGISLDGVPDSHGHTMKYASTSDGQSPGAPSIAQIRESVSRMVEKRGINYPVLLDPENQVGSRFNGGELPTTILIDSQGLIRRRFVGPRLLATLEAMIAQFDKSPAP
jgi:thiol-disulfide isomerase/thioredoxin